MTPDQVAWSLLAGGGGGGGLAFWLLRRSIGRVDRLEARMNGLELAIAKDMPSKEDYAQLAGRLDRLDNTLSQVRDMVIRLEERGKVHDRME